jgi:hypothetical protein
LGEQIEKRVKIISLLQQRNCRQFLFSKVGPRPGLLRPCLFNSGFYNALFLNFMSYFLYSFQYSMHSFPIVLDACCCNIFLVIYINFFSFSPHKYTFKPPNLSSYLFGYNTVLVLSSRMRLRTLIASAPVLEVVTMTKKN